MRKLLSFPVQSVFVLLLLLFPACNKPHTPGEAEITRIVDGDTYHVLLNGKDEKIRLIGIDTPESKRNKKAVKDARRGHEDIDDIVAMGKEAAAFVKTLIKPGDHVRVEIDARERDQYGRILAYLYLPDGRMLNEAIIRAGYANPLTYPPNVKYQKLFLEAYEDARNNNRGLWKTITR